MRKLTIVLFMAIIISTIIYSADQYATQDKAAAEAAFYCVNETFWSWLVDENDVDGKHIVEDQYLKLDKLIGIKGVNFILIVPEIKTVNKKKICITKTLNHRISADTFRWAVATQHAIVKAANSNEELPESPNDPESLLLKLYIDNYVFGAPDARADEPIVQKRESVGVWSWDALLHLLPEGVSKPNPLPRQRIKFVKNNGVWQIDEIQIFMITNIRKDLLEKTQTGP